jgi:hypothetical protein
MVDGDCNQNPIIRWSRLCWEKEGVVHQHCIWLVGVRTVVTQTLPNCMDLITHHL